MTFLNKNFNKLVTLMSIIDQNKDFIQKAILKFWLTS